MEHYYTWYLHKPHFKQSQTRLTFFLKEETKQAGIEAVLKEKHETWKTSVVHKNRRGEVEKYHKNFQRNGDHDMEEKIWKSLTKIINEKILKVTEKLRLNVYSPFYLFHLTINICYSNLM